LFDEVTKREGGKNAARRAGYVFGSTAFQVVVIAAIVFAGERIKTAVQEKAVEVKFVRSAAPPRPAPPPPPAPPPKPKSAPRTDNGPKLPPPPPTALLQPKEVQEEMKAPSPNEPKEPEYDYGSAPAGEGVVGGVVGAQRTNEIEDAPAFATAGFVKPSEKDRGCVGRSVRIPREFQGFVKNLTVKFAVGRDGVPSLYECLTPDTDKRIADAVWQAIQSCQFSPGTDPRGQPQKIWLILPLRFSSG